MAVLSGTLSGEAAKARALSRTSGGDAPAPISSQFHCPNCLVWAPDQNCHPAKANFLEKKPTIWGKTRGENDVRRYP